MKFKPGDKIVYMGEYSRRGIGGATNIVLRYDTDLHDLPHVMLKDEMWSNGFFGIGGVYEENIDLCPRQTLLSPEL